MYVCMDGWMRKVHLIRVFVYVSDVDHLQVNIKKQCMLYFK